LTVLVFNLLARWLGRVMLKKFTATK